MKNEMTSRLGAFAASAPFRWLVWLGFAIVFYKSGETFTVWLLQPGQIAGGFEWIWIALFPVLLPVFFIVNRRFGCASGACAARNGSGAGARFPGH
jgi:hypothetical protein